MLNQAGIAMHGLMMDRPLSITSIMRYAEQYHPRREIVSVTGENPRHRYTYADAFGRVRRLASALARLGLKPGERVATLASEPAIAITVSPAKIVSFLMV